MSLESQLLTLSFNTARTMAESRAWAAIQKARAGAKVQKDPNTELVKRKFKIGHKELEFCLYWDTPNYRVVVKNKKGSPLASANLSARTLNEVLCQPPVANNVELIAKLIETTEGLTLINKLTDLAQELSVAEK